MIGRTAPHSDRVGDKFAGEISIASAISRETRNAMTINPIAWTGIACCLTALVINLFPALAQTAGVDMAGARTIFTFGIFLVLAGLSLSAFHRPPR